MPLRRGRAGFRLSTESVGLFSKTKGWLAEHIHTIDSNKLEVYAETAKRRYFVGILSRNPENNTFEFVYDHDYMRMRSAIPLGPDIPFGPLPIISKPGRLFGTFENRIPSKENPAYPEYCYSQGISPNEKNYIILLAITGKQVHAEVRTRLFYHFKNQLSSNESASKA